ncbi:hypothetical protein JCM8097_009105 [Rhodosporidiobolus ruineniae]
MADTSILASASSQLPILDSAPSPARPARRQTPAFLARLRPRWRLTLLGRCIALLVGEFAANVALWIAAAIVWRKEETRAVLSLAVVAWTLGLRHGLDMDHIVAIDNVTRNLVSLGQLPVTVGLFFSLGHSSIVIGMTIAVIITVSAIDKLDDISSVGGVVGVCVSASFLFVLAVINSISLWQSIHLSRKRREMKRALATERADTSTPVASSSPVPSHSLTSAQLADPSIAKKLPAEDEELGNEHEREREVVEGLPATTCIARIGRPIFRLIDRPWKMYPVGVLFGFGFDTASEISLLGVSALAKGTHHIPAGQIILLPLLFTAGMSAVDSLDSVFMLSAYTVPQRAERGEFDEDAKLVPARAETTEGKKPWYRRRWQLFERLPAEGEEADEDLADARARALPKPNQDKLLGISVALTVISIVVALLISVTEFMGLALEKCASCSDAAEHDPGLSGRWWRFWASVNDNSGYLGAGVVGLFVVVFATWGVMRWVGKRRERRERDGRGGASRE